MRFFSRNEFLSEYPEYAHYELTNRYINAACDMIFSQVGLRYRNASWASESVPLPIKEASMEQLVFMLEHDIPFVDYDKHIKAGEMEADLKSDYSTLALRKLANHGYLYRGNPIQANMNLGIPFGD